MALSIEKRFSVDLDKPLIVQYGGGLMFTGDAGADTFEITLYKSGEAYAPGGSVALNCIRADGNTVTVTGSISGNVASATLTQACCAIPGPLSVVMQITSGGNTGAIFAAAYTVMPAQTGEPIDPGTTITDIAALIAQIDAAVDSIPADYSDLLAAIAPTFSASTVYAAGDYVWYDGDLYKFIAAHSAGAWTGSDVTAAVFATDISELKSAIDDLEDDMSKVFPRQYTLNEMLEYVPANIPNGAVLHIESKSGAEWPAQWGLIFYDEDKTQLTAVTIPKEKTEYDVTVSVTGTAFLRGNSAMPWPMVITVKDTTGVTLETKIAKNTTDISKNATEIEELNGAAYVIRNVTHTKDVNVLDFVLGIYTNTGNINTSLTTYYHSPLLPVQAGFQIAYTNLRTYGGWCLIACFDTLQNFIASKSVISEDSNFKTGSFTVPSGVGYISIMAYNPNTAVANPYEAIIPEAIPVSEIVQQSGGAWNGKTAVVIGDSITDGLYTPTGGSTPDARANPTYWETAGSIIGIGSFVGYGISGTSISRTSPTLPSYAMSIRYVDMINGADLVIVAGGTNDYGTNVSLGTIADTTDVSFYGALHVLCDGLQTKYPGKRMVFITPIHRANEGANDAGATLDQYRQAIYDVARDVYGYAVIDGRTMGISCANSAFKNIYIYDGLHPTQEGHNVYGQALGHALNGI